MKSVKENALKLMKAESECEDPDAAENIGLNRYMNSSIKSDLRKSQSNFIGALSSKNPSIITEQAPIASNILDRIR